MSGEGSTFTFEEGIQQTQMTLAGVVLCHYITDEQLIDISQNSNGDSKDICLLSLGALFASMAPAMQGLSDFAEKKADLVDLCSIIIFSTSILFSLVFALLWRKSAKKTVSTLDSIRSRPKVSVRVG